MTQNYLIGELSVRLGQLAAACGPGASGNAVRLRYQIENGPPAGLATAAVQCLEVADDLCWESLSRGDVAAFDRQSVLTAELRDFIICACLLQKG